MPELPEVETVVRAIRPLLVGRVFGKTGFSVPRQMLPQTPTQLSRALRGKLVKDVRRRGKHILIEIAGGTLLVHLRMTGRLFVRRADAEMLPHERAWFELDEGRDLLVFHDPRTLGTIRYFAEGTEITPLLKMGWEPLEETLDLAELKAKLSRRQTAIKPLLLDQSLWAGIGNIYASEALWEAGIDPRRHANKLSRIELARLSVAIVKVLRRALEQGGSTLRDFADPGGNPGSYQKEFLVYGREGEACDRCGKPILKFVQAQRSTYYCKGCQRGAKSGKLKAENGK